MKTHSPTHPGEVLREDFILPLGITEYRVALHRSVGDAALQAGNSESIVKKHSLNLQHQEEVTVFFSLIPDLSQRKSIVSTHETYPALTALRAI